MRLPGLGPDAGAGIRPLPKRRVSGPALGGIPPTTCPRGAERTRGTGYAAGRVTASRVVPGP